MNLSASTFQPGKPANPTPAPFVPAKPVDPPKEKTVILIERIVKGSDVDVKTDTMTDDEKSRVKALKETVDSIKSAEKLSVDLLKAMVNQFKDVLKLPESLVKKSVHSRIIKRGDDGEDKPLIDKKGDRMGRPTGEHVRRGGPGRGRGDHHGEGRYNDRNGKGGRGQRGGHGGFERGPPAPEPVYDEKWRTE